LLHQLCSRKLAPKEIRILNAHFVTYSQNEVKCKIFVGVKHQLTWRVTRLDLASVLLRHDTVKYSESFIKYYRFDLGDNTAYN
jgi:hypothetical protein